MPAFSEKLDSLTGLSSDERQALDRLVARDPRKIGHRRDLLREGDEMNGLFVVAEGWACRYKALPDGRRQIVGFLIPGDISDFHMGAIRTSDHNIGAITALAIVEFGCEELAAIMDERPAVRSAVRRDEMVTLSIQREWTFNLGQRTAIERLAHLIVELFLRLEAIGRTEGESCDFPLTQVDLADAAGLTPVHVNRTLQELRREKLIELQDRRLTIPDMRALKRVAMFDSNYLHRGMNGARGWQRG